MSTDFRAALIEQAKRSVAASPHCRTEEAAKIALVIPFIGFLGYDTTNPAEVTPEHAADFSQKYPNKVDFAIMQDGLPVMAIECKGVGVTRVDDKGQLKSYFNAAKTVKLGVLSDGIVWDFFADSDDPNLMDDSAFLSLDLRKVSEGQVSDQVVEGLQQLKKGSYNPENIGAEAKRKLILKSFVDQIGELMAQPSEALCRLLLEGAGLKHIRSKNLPEYQELVKRAFKTATDSSILARLEIKPPVTATPEPLLAPPVDLDAEEPSQSALQVFAWVERRLSFLVKDETHFATIGNIVTKQNKSNFVIYLGGSNGGVNKGRILTFEERGETWRFQFASGEELTTRDLFSLDEPLLASFAARTA
ncbi:MAG TPA: type I restriction endonuclease [Caulobacteraceae bacterium]